MSRGSRRRARIVTFFPTLVNVTLALRATPQASIDLFHAYGAGPLKTLRKVQLPNALPAIFASLRIAAPLALIGALLAEWLATGHGLGYLMLQSSSLSNYNMLWSAAALVTTYSMILSASISGIEKWVSSASATPLPDQVGSRTPHRIRGFPARCIPANLAKNRQHGATPRGPGASVSRANIRGRDRRPFRRLLSLRLCAPRRRALLRHG